MVLTCRVENKVAQALKLLEEAGRLDLVVLNMEECGHPSEGVRGGGSRCLGLLTAVLPARPASGVPGRSCQLFIFVSGQSSLLALTSFASIPLLPLSLRLHYLCLQPATGEHDGTSMARKM
ncbi:hypothetical protein NDU88_001810 [Pleurodeles waltl]|uniref:Uncharacterized protein n=1 Tax=Pleurodeles waltl TaxID=8319 RepID=A0AAV7UX12_PLEWA|nr:hypothetical protein NDU88_001810 [Pleurodeles waltl]